MKDLLNELRNEELEVIISVYKDIDDEIGTSEIFKIDNTLTIKDLVRQLAKKYKANMRDFNLEDTNTSKVLSKVNYFDFDFHNRKGNEFAFFYKIADSFFCISVKHFIVFCSANDINIFINSVKKQSVTSERE